MDRVDLLVQGRMEVAALDRVEGLDLEMIVEDHARGFRTRILGGAKEDATEEYKRKGAHLGIWVSGTKIRDRLYTYLRGNGGGCAQSC